MKFNLIQFRLFRKFYKGTYYLIAAPGFDPFWTQMAAVNCLEIVLKTEVY